jgi:molybdate transport system substrate-binding protein
MSAKRILAILAIAAVHLCGAGACRAQDVSVFAAASLTNAITEIGEKFAAQGLGGIKPAYAASSTLAKQIENGAPADVFMSADLEWMDYLAAKGLIVAASRVNLVGNTLVLVAPADANTPDIHIGSGVSIARLAGEGRIATGDPDHVPVGKYARQAFEKLGQWAEIEPKLARMDSVRAALALVERGEVPFGIVYATDAALSKKVKVVATFPDTLHPPIVYPAALVAGRDSAAGRAFMDFLSRPEAKGIFAKYGFKLN